MAAAYSYDLIVVGAGPAGSTAARLAALRGARVALVDKAVFPRDKLCGGALTARALTYLQMVHGPFPAHLGHPCGTLQFCDGRRVLAEEIGPLPLVLTMRRSLDAHLRQSALDAGAEDWAGHRIADFDLGLGQIVLTSGDSLRAPTMIGADGVHSAVARALFGQDGGLTSLGLALEAEVDGAPGQQMSLDLTAVPFGYGWEFPKPHGVTYGLGGIEARSDDMKGRFQRWLVARGVDPASVRIKGHHLPFGKARSQIGRGGVVLAGDAAGLVDAVTGEGIAWAIRSGQLAGEAVLDALAQGRPDRTHAHYTEKMRVVLAEVSRAGRLARLAYHPFWQPKALRAIENSGHLRRRYLQLLAGEMDHADIGPARMMRLLLRLTLARGSGGLG